MYEAAASNMAKIVCLQKHNLSYTRITKYCNAPPSALVVVISGALCMHAVMNFHHHPCEMSIVLQITSEEDHLFGSHIHP